jgi:hypothetical protein
MDTQRSWSVRACALALAGTMAGGTGWLACSSSSGGKGAGGGSDASSEGQAAEAGPETGGADGGAGDAASGCPSPPSGAATFHPSTGYPMNVCSTADLTALVTDCIGSTFDGPKCAQDHTAYPACAACLFTPYDAPALGPFVTVNNLLALNIGGCISLVMGDSSPGGCGAAIGVSMECIVGVCISCTHPLPEGGIGAADGGFAGDLTKYNDCALAVTDDGGACGAQNAAINDVCPLPEPPSFSACLQQKTEQQVAFFQRVGSFFCGGGAPDGGAEGGVDGGVEGGADGGGD